MPKLIEYEGMLAVDWGWYNNWNQPKQERLIRKSKAFASAYPHLLECEVDFAGNYGFVRAPYAERHTQLGDVTEWETIIKEREVKKPRRGKYYDYEWHNGQWVRYPDYQTKGDENNED